MSTEELDEKPKALPPQKRRRVIKDDEDDEDASFHDEEEEDDDEEELIDHSDKENGTENDEQDTPRKQINKPGAPPEAGVIDEILVEDFMCHKKLRVKLCRNVNFINGANGSGKSAILAAIQICLGAGARRTHRARSLKELIRKDGSSTPSCAKVQVTLLNGGSDGYKQDVYGKKITVERCISNGSGYNGYKLLDEKGKERSRSKKDLDEMLDTLNIQVDNPVSILDQEESKKFLTGKSSDKYNFFMKATELERIDNKFSTALDTLQEMTASQAKLIESLERDKKQVQELKKRWEVHKELDKMQDKIRSLGVKYAWAFFQVADKEHADAVTDYETFMAKAAKKEEELTQLQLSMSQPKEQEDRLNNKSHELIEEGNKQSALKNDLEIRLRNAKHPVKDLERQLAASKREEARAKTALHAAQKRLKEVRDQIIAKAGSAKEEAARRASELKEAEEALEEATARKEELVQRVSTAHQQYEEHEPQLKDKKAQVKEIKRQIQVVEGRIQSLSQTTDELAVFGRNVKRMHDMIEKTKREKKFRGPVLGPIGKHIKVVPGKEKYAAIAELAVGRGNLDRFIVTNDHDRRLVQSIRDKIGCQKDCNIFQVKDTGRYNVPPPPAGVENVCTVFAISEDLVFNCLVDQCRIDQSGLADDRKSSQELLLHRESGGSYKISGILKNVYCLPKGDRWYVSGGNPSEISNEKPLTKTIGVDTTTAVKRAQKEAADLAQELKALEKEEHDMEGIVHRHQKEWNRAQKERKANELRISELKETIATLNEEIESSANTEIDTTEYEDEVKVAEEDVQKFKDVQVELKAKIEEKMPEIEDLTKQLKEVTLRNEQVLRDMQEVQKQLTQFQTQQSQNDALVEKHTKKLAQYKLILEKHQEKMDQLAEARADALRQARVIHFKYVQQKELDSDEAISEESLPEPTDAELEGIEPPKIERDCDYYETKKKKAEEALEKERKRRKVSNEDPEVAHQAYIRAKKTYDSKQAQAEDLEQRVNELGRDINKRKKRWNAMRKHLVSMTKVKFDEFLNMNKYGGTLSFDHEEKTLDLAVHKGVTADSDQVTQDVKGLSGGERSFTTICLLLALGEKLETPFRILDEFDVFLDAQARKLTMKALIFTAKQMEHRQFIFITPQDLSSLTPDNQLKIFKLQPPERRQIAGGPTQQTLDFSQAST